MVCELQHLVETLKLKQLKDNLFQGTSPQVGWQRVFGGLVISQALAAAQLTVSRQRNAHSLHGYFIRPGDPAVPIDYHVERNSDGKSFANRQVTAMQHEKPILSLSASFHKTEPGLDHQIQMPDVVSPESLPSERDLLNSFHQHMPENMRRYFERERPIELRPTNTERYMYPKPEAQPVQNIWFRATGRLPDDYRTHQCFLAYASDMTLLDTALVVHGKNLFDPKLMMASLDHAIWFHRPFRADEWLLYSQESPSMANARGFARGSIFTSEGILIASVSQEGLIREIDSA